MRADNGRPLRAAIVVALALLPCLAGCRQDPVGPDPTKNTGPPGNTRPPARVVVVNSSSETLSNLDPVSGEMTVVAAYAGTWANRISAVPDGSTFLVAASGDNEIQIVNVADLSLQRTIDTGPAASPWLAFAWEPTRAIVTNWAAGEVRLLDLATGVVGPGLPTSTAGPEGIAVRDGRAFVTCTGFLAEGSYGQGRVDVVDLAAGRMIASLDVGTNPQDAIVASDGRIHVLCTGNYGSGSQPVGGTVYRIDPAAAAVVDSLQIGGSPGRLVEGPPGEIWVAGFAGGVRRYATDTFTLLPAASDPGLTQPGFSALAWDSVAATMYVTHFDLDLLIAVDANSFTIERMWLVGDGPVDVIVSRPGVD
jgi:sugar lactone lactonase YvrE